MEEKIKKYDQLENLIYQKIIECHEDWYKYDKNNNRIYHKNSSGIEEWWEYDENNREIYYRDHNGYKEWYSYNKNNKLICLETFEENDKCYYKYDEEGDTIEITKYEYSLILSTK